MSNKLQEIKKIRLDRRDLIIQREEVKKEKHQLKDFHFLSANLNKFMPEIPFEKHWDIYIDVLYTIFRRNYDTQLSSCFNDLNKDFKSQTLNKLSSQDPKIFITCHLGFCKVSLVHLFSSGFNKVVMLVDNQTYKKQVDSIHNTVNKYIKEDLDIEFKLEILDVEKANIGVEMIKYIREGYSLLAYVDGNSGYKGVYNKKNTITVNFLESKILARTGLATVSYFSKTPIVTFVSYYPEDDFPVTTFLDYIDPKEFKNTREYTEKTTKKIYKSFEVFIKKYYDQWESWFYFHKYLDEDTLKNKNKTIKMSDLTKDDFANNKMALFKIDKNCYLFDKILFSIYPINLDQFNELQGI